METEKKQLISRATFDKVRKVEEKIAKALIKFSAEYNCSLNDELYIRIIGRDNDLPVYAVYNKNIKLADVEIGEIISLNALESMVISEESIQENIYRNMDKILIGFEKEAKLSELEIYIFTKTENGKPLFYLYRNGKPHKQIRSYQII